MNVTKEARNDAREHARAQMFYGEGAGVRRKLINATVEGKTAKYGAEYKRAFNDELDRQDWSEHAKKAHREREFKDKSHTLSKNVKGLATGNYQGVNTGVIVVVTVAYFAHQTGVDKLVLDKSKRAVDKVRRWNQDRKARARVIYMVKDA